MIGINKEQFSYFDYLLHPSFQGVNSPFLLSFENKSDREVHTKNCIPKTEIKDYNVIIDGRNFFDQPIKIGLKTYDNIRNIETGQGGDYTTGCLLDYPYFKKHYKLIATDLNKQQILDADPNNFRFFKRSS